MGSRAVKLMLLARGLDRTEIRGAGSIDYPTELIREGVVFNPKAFGRLLANELREFGSEPDAGVFAIPSNLAALRWVTLPNLEHDELRDAARFKVKRHLPYPVEEAYVDASPPECPPGEDSGPSLVVAVKREVVDSRAQTLEAAGIDPVAAELEAQSVLRIIERRLDEQSALWRDASLTIIDVGGSNTHMYVVQNQRLQFIRGVRFGADIIARAIATALEIDRDEADTILGNPTTRLMPNGVVDGAFRGDRAIVNVEPELQKLIREFLRLIRYFRSLHPERSYAGILDNVVVCGGLAGLHGFTEYLSQELELRVERARPFAGMVAQLNRETFEIVSNRQEAFTVVMGLALAGLQRPTSLDQDNNAKREYLWKRAA